jgi:hypothetical protein
MDTERLLSDQTVVVSGSRISRWGPAPAPLFPGRAPDRRARALPDAGARGHARPCLRSRGADPLRGERSHDRLQPDGRPAHLLWRRRVARGELFGPAIYTAGPTFRAPRSADEAVREVDRQADAGYDAVKIYNEVSKTEYPALTAEAKRRNLILVGHVAREPGFAATLAAGQSIAHAEELVYTVFNDDPDPRNEVVHPLDTAKIPRAVA